MKESLVFSKRNGQYGANQGRLKDRWQQGYQEDRTFIRQIMFDLAQKKVSDEYIGAYLNILNRQGCGFAAAANIILNHYAICPESFEQNFGFSFFQTEGRVNFDELVLRLFYSQKNWHELPLIPVRFKLPQPGVRAGDLTKNIAWFTKKHGTLIKGKQVSTRADEKVKNALAKGQLVNMTCYYQPMHLLAPKGTFYKDYTIGFHTVVLTDYDEATRRYSLSSWGRRYELAQLPLLATLYVY